MLTIERAPSLELLAPEWKALLQRQAQPLPFAHPVFQRAWLDEFQDGRELLLLAAREGDRLVGVAPLLKGDGTLSFVGHHSICDYLDFVVAPGEEDAFFGVLAESLQREAWNEIELRGLRAGSPTLERLPATLEAAGLRVEREEEAVAPCVVLPESWDAYLAQLPSKSRHELKRKLRRLTTFGQPELRRYTEAEQIEELLPLLLRFMVESRSDKAAFMSERMASFFHRLVSALAREGLVRLYLLELDTRPVAAVLCFDLGGRLYMYNSGYDPEHASLAVGLISKALCVRDAIESGKRAVDFLRGHEHYKYDLGGVDQRVERLVVRRG